MVIGADLPAFLPVTIEFLAACGLTSVSQLIAHRLFRSTLQAYSRITDKRAKDLVRRRNNRANARTDLHPGLHTAVLAAFNESLRLSTVSSVHIVSEAEFQQRVGRLADLRLALQKLPVLMEYMTTKLAEEEAQLRASAIALSATRAQTETK